MYEPREDSYLLADAVKTYVNSLDNKDIKVLDMGSGSGIQAKSCIEAGVKKSNIICVDVDPKVISQLKKQGLIAKRSDLFTTIKGKFDLIIFNPPYLPEDKYTDITTGAGKRGYELIIKFLEQVKSHLSKDGTTLLLISSLSKLSVVLKYARKYYKTRKVGEKKIFFEKLIVLEIKAVQ